MARRNGRDWCWRKKPRARSSGKRWTRHQFLRHGRRLFAGGRARILGRAIKDFAKRDEVVIATKLFNPMGPSVNSRACRATCDGGDRHFAAPARHGLCRSLSDSSLRSGRDRGTVEALNDVVRAGKALYVGASSMWTDFGARIAPCGILRSVGADVCPGYRGGLSVRSSFIPRAGATLPVSGIE